MALKLNIKPILEEEIDSLRKKTGFRSKTEYINHAIAAFNDKIKRDLEICRLKSYFDKYRNEGKKVLNEFTRIKDRHD